jgi:hypothetical protein
MYGIKGLNPSNDPICLTSNSLIVLLLLLIHIGVHYPQLVDRHLSLPCPSPLHSPRKVSSPSLEESFTLETLSFPLLEFGLFPRRLLLLFHCPLLQESFALNSISFPFLNSAFFLAASSSSFFLFLQESFTLDSISFPLLEPGLLPRCRLLLLFLFCRRAIVVISYLATPLPIAPSQLPSSLSLPSS